MVADFVERIPVTALRGLEVIVLARSGSVYVLVAVIMILAFVMSFDECDSSDLVILISDNCKTQIFFASFHFIFLRALPDFFIGGVCRIFEGCRGTAAPLGLFACK